MNAWRMIYAGDKQSQCPEQKNEEKSSSDEHDKAAICYSWMIL